MVLPAGFALPPVPYVVALVVGMITVAAGAWRVRPRVSAGVVVGFAPWMVVGGGLHVLYQTDAGPQVLLPFFGTAAAYVSTFVVAGTVWVVASWAVEPDRVPWILGAAGAVTVVPVVGVLWAAGGGPTRVGVPVFGLVGSVVLTAVAWAGVRRFHSDTTRVTGWVGALVVFGHVLDGVSTLIGIDILGLEERTPIPRLIMDLAAQLPTADLIGVGWLFVAVKLGLAVVIVWLFADYLREEPVRAYILLGLIMAVGLGPGAHNLFLYTVG